MGLLEGKKGLILGLANDRSIAWGIAQAFHREGAQLGFNYIEAVESRVRPLAESLGAAMIERCDVSRDDEIAALMAVAAEKFGTIDFIIHAVAFAKKEELNGSILDTSREGFRIALDISCYSLLAVTKAAQPILAPGAAILTLSYHGARAVVKWM
jgi:enoyl-[acyl-carrier protein] reductase I